MLDQINELEKTAGGQKKSSIPFKIFCLLFLAGMVLLLAHFDASKKEAEATEKAVREQEISLGPRVRVVPVKMSKGERVLTVLGEARPLRSMTFYSRVTGYIREIVVNRGDTVKKGDPLAIIEAPDTLHNYRGALAEEENKKAIARRMKKLGAKKLVTPLEVEQAIADVGTADAKLGALAIEKGYGTLRAPFDGTVTARFADPGALAGGSTLPIVTISQLDQLRVYAYVDQKDASYVKAGGLVTIRLTERPDVEIKAKVSRVAGELDPKSRTLMVLIDVDNTAGQLVAGSFVQVSIAIPTKPRLQIPAEALISKKGKSRVAVITADNLLSLREIKVLETDGKFANLLSGIEEGSLVGLNVGDRIADGTKVRPLLESLEPSRNKSEGIGVTPPAANSPRTPSGTKAETTGAPIKKDEQDAKILTNLKESH